MKLYLLLSKTEFASLIRFGEIPLKYIPSFSGVDLNALKNYLLQIFKEDCPFFESDEAYIVIEVGDEIGKANDLRISQALKIYPLTRAAKHSYELKFDIGFKFEDAIFEEAYEDYQNYVDIQEHKRGADAIRKLFEKYFSNKVYCPTDISFSLDHLIELKINGKKSFSHSGTHFYENLLLYDRDEFFPNNDFGYFYDVGQILAHYNGRPSFKGSKLHSYLQENRLFFEDKKQLSKMIPLLEESNEKTAGLKDKLTSADGSKDYITALYFLYFKNLLLNKDNLSDTNIEVIVEYSCTRNMYVRELLQSLNLIGYYFGYKKFYYDLYNLKEVKIYKTKIIDDDTLTSGQRTIQETDLTKVDIKTNLQPIVDGFLKKDFIDFPSDYEGEFNDSGLVHEGRDLGSSVESDGKININEELDKNIHDLANVNPFPQIEKIEEIVQNEILNEENDVESEALGSSSVHEYILKEHPEDIVLKYIITNLQNGTLELKKPHLGPITKLYQRVSHNDKSVKKPEILIFLQLNYDKYFSFKDSKLTLLNNQQHQINMYDSGDKN
ncbi:hypothetical protein [Arcticibacter eurypsychrophilus]|uniref:hypothetical protein n=1 Tax=Arcticibacter eurypsychrophilus TaxID=1434752 RepID=UPI00084D5EEC|nr:hypothetical protein [Arcticibacter eurypsychrophilus]